MTLKDQKLLDDFFAENLSDEQQKQFIKKGASDPVFVRELVRRIELEEAFDDLYHIYCTASESRYSDQKEIHSGSYLHTPLQNI